MLLKRRKTYTIDNIYNDDATVAFILESPHIAEVHHNYPLAGKSGREISKILINRYDIPFGLIAKYNCLLSVLNIPPMNNFCILNVSKGPLQKKAYLVNGKHLPENIELMENLKRLIQQGANFNTLHQKAELNTLKKEIYLSFLAECKNNLKFNTLLIPCGKFASVFCIEIIKHLPDFKFELIDHIPHPSRGWDKVDIKTINRIKERLYIKNIP